ncbi:MAG TPA: tyrosine-type recombinase/integrase [Ktedonobacterales bacterium]|nr:tyrosine-type recombinase/integrase [Ktedonobacterales bacterium]
MELFYTDYWALTGGYKDLDSHTTRMVKALQRAGIADHMPFILEADGSYDARLNQFFRELPLNGVRSPKSWRSYALDLLTWMRFLVQCRGKTIWDGDHDDLVAFHGARRGVTMPLGNLPEPSVDFAQIDASSWNRCVAALDKFYRWAQAKAYIREVPFTYRQGQRRQGEVTETIQRNEALERAARHGDMRFLSMDDYLRFREIGLRGHLPDGRDDPAFRGRNGARNAAFAELLVTTGIRLEEANSFLMIELPTFSLQSSEKNYPFSLAPGITKGEKGRTIRLPKRVLQLLQQYQQIERDSATARAQQKGTYQALSRSIGVMSTKRHTCIIQLGNKRISRQIDRIPPSERCLLYHCAAPGTLIEPLALWLTEQGLPMKTDSWEAIFAQASVRCRQFGFDLEVTPHMLRHTFAVHMLAMLIEEQIGALFPSSGEELGAISDPSTAGAAAYRRLAGDPLRTLQRLLGHASITSTMIYLSNVMEAQKLVDNAIHRYATALSALLGEEDSDG